MLQDLDAVQSSETAYPNAINSSRYAHPRPFRALKTQVSA